MPSIMFYRDDLELQIDSPPKVYKTRDGHHVEEYRVDGEKGFFVTLHGTHYCAHGESLAEAIGDATWKDESKRPSLDALKDEIREAGTSRKISLNEFKVLTGACSAGCRIALKRAKLSGEPMLAEDVIKYFPEWGRKLYHVLEWRIPDES